MQVAQQQGRENSVREGMVDTDKAYDELEAARYVLAQVSERYAQAWGWLCARKTARRSTETEEIERLGISRDDKYVVTVHLRGLVP